MSGVPFTVATYNVLAPEYALPGPDRRFFYAGREAHLPWAVRAPRLRARLDGLAADILCLQEVSVAQAAPTLAGHLERSGHHVHAVGADDRPDALLLAARAARFTVRAVRRVPSSVSLVLCADLHDLATGRDLRVLTAHLKWTPEGDRQATEVATALAAYGRDDPTVLCGDLNYAVAHHATTPGLVAAGWRLAHPDGRAPTWAADGRRELLDALLVGPGLVVTHAHAIPVLPAGGLPSAHEPSDHVPLAADVAFEDVAS